MIAAYPHFVVIQERQLRPGNASNGIGVNPQTPHAFLANATEALQSIDSTILSPKSRLTAGNQQHPQEQHQSYTNQHRRAGYDTAVEPQQAGKETATLDARLAQPSSSISDADTGLEAQIGTRRRRVATCIFLSKF